MHVVQQHTSDHQAEHMLKRIAAGDRIAEQLLVDTYYRGLFFILHRQTRNATLAEDLTQDTFIIVLQKARENAIQNPAALAAFIRQTGINLFIAYLRKEKRRDTHVAEDIEIHSPVDGYDLSRGLHSNQLMQLTSDMINELSVHRDREILRSYFVYEQSKSQICEQLALSPEHFDRVLFRARQRLRQLLENHITRTDDGKTLSVSNLLGVAMVCGLSLAHNPMDKFIGNTPADVRETSAAEHLSDNSPLNLDDKSEGDI